MTDTPRDFYNRRNIWNVICSTWFFEGYRGVLDKGIRFKDTPTTQVPGLRQWYENLNSRRLDHNEKIARCAHELSQLVRLESFPAEYILRDPTEEELLEQASKRREQWVRDIAASARRDQEAAEGRQQLIKSGAIVLPDPKRPWEIWQDRDEYPYHFRLCTQRNEAAARLSLTHRAEGCYIQYCPGDETTRRRV